MAIQNQIGYILSQFEQLDTMLPLSQETKNEI